MVTGKCYPLETTKYNKKNYKTRTYWSAFTTILQIGDEEGPRKVKRGHLIAGRLVTISVKSKINL